MLAARRRGRLPYSPAARPRSEGLVRTDALPEPRPARDASAAPVRKRLWRLVRPVLVLLVAGPPALILAFRALPPPATPLMLIRLAEGHALRQEWVAYERVAPALAEAVIAAEDNRFCEQALGFDFAALRGQVAAWRDGERPRGASTITMQTAKNLLLWPRSEEHTFE